MYRNVQKQQTCLWKVSNFTQRCFVGMQVFYPCYQTDFFTTFCSVSFFIKTMLFQKGKPLKKHFLFILLALYTFANYHSFRRFCWREKYHLWFLNCNTIYWIHKKYPNRGYSCWLCQEKGGENLPSSAVLKISCKLILRTKWWNEKDFQYSKTRKLLHPHNLSFTKCQNHVLRQTKRGTA